MKSTAKKFSPKAPRLKNEASSPKKNRGLAAIENIPQVQLGIWGFKALFITAIVVGTGYVIYKKVTEFKDKKYDGTQSPSNVSDNEAAARAKAIASSLALFDYVGDEFEITSKNLKGLNYNGFVKVYNAFGEQKGHAFKGKLNLIDWIFDQFSDYEVQQLSFLTAGKFF